MIKSEITRIKLKEALNRILTGKPIIIPDTQKLSVKAVEEEAGLGDGSAYYYKDIVEKIKILAVQNSPQAKSQNIYEEKIVHLRERLNNEVRLKTKYRTQIEELKEQLAKMASQHNQLALLIQQYQYKIAELESDNTMQYKKTD